MADARIESDVARWIGAAVESHGHINVLYNNAAYTHFALHEMKLEDWQAAVQGELDVVFLGCKHALSHMMRQASGVIVSTASISGLVSTELPGLVGGMAHAAGKAGVMGLTRNLAQEYARHGIRANAIAPGLVETPSNPGLHVPAYRDEAIRRTPLGRIGKPEDVAYAARYLCSDEASFVTGQVLVVDGGWSIY